MKLSIKNKIRRWIKKSILRLMDYLGNPLILDCQKTLLKLSALLIVPIYLVIRGSTSPLLFDNPLCVWLFYSDPEGDKTLYNIGISIIAAYIFYIFQVFIPEYKKIKRNQKSFSEIHKYEIFLINQFCLAWKTFLGNEVDYCTFCSFNYSYKVNSNINEGGSITEETYKETIEAIHIIGNIIKKPLFKECDISYQEFICISYAKIKGHIKYIHDIFPCWSDQPLPIVGSTTTILDIIKDFERIQSTLSKIENYKITDNRIIPFTEVNATQQMFKNIFD